jgi:Tol biopolymer transport system component
VTSSGVEVTGQSLTQDGKKLAFSGNRAGKQDLWEKSLVDGREAPFVADDYSRAGPRWSRDGTRLAYFRYTKGGGQLVVWSSQSRNEEPITTSRGYREVRDWSPDGKWLLISQGNNDTHRAELWLLPVAARPHAEAASRKITSNLAYNLFDGQFSPDGRWIVFEAVKQPPTPNAESALYVLPATGGPWTRLSEGEHWDDKPRWSPDGNMIYFVSDRSGFFNVWGIHFDATKGKPVGEPFRVTAFETPALMLPAPFDRGEPSITRDHLVLTLEDLSGSIWILDNVSP